MLILALSACSAERFRAEEPWSTTPEIRVFVLAGRSAIRVHAAAAGEPLDVPIEELLEGGAPVTVWTFGYTRAQLAGEDPALSDLEPKELASRLSPNLSGEGPAAPEPAEVLRAELERGEADVAYTRASWSDWLADEARAGRAPLSFGGVTGARGCVQFEVVTHRLSGASGRGIMAVHAGGDRAVAAPDDGGLYEVTPTGTRDLGVPRDPPYLAGFAADDGLQWLLTAGGNLVRGNLEQGFEMVSRTTLRGGRAFMWIDGAVGGAPFELFTMNDDQELERFDGTSWTTLHAGRAGDNTWQGGVAWAGPEEAVAVVGAGASGVLRYRRGTITEERLAVEEAIPTAVARIPALGTVVATETGALFVDRGGFWERLPGIPTGVPVYVIAPLDRGVLFGGGAGALAQWHPDTGYCRPEGYGSVAIWDIAPIEGGFVLMHSNRNIPGDTVVRVMKRLP